MTIYIITIAILAILSFIELEVNSKKVKNNILIIGCIILILETGLRWETGTDWEPYLNAFKNLNSIKDVFSISNGMEIGYNIFVYLSKLISPSYSIFLLVHSILYYFLLFLFLKFIIPYRTITLLLIYCSTIGLLGSNRQLIALVICLNSLKFIREKNINKFIMYIIIAATFHLTAIIFVIYYFIDKDIEIKKLAFIIIISILIGYSKLPEILFSYFVNLIGFGFGGKYIIYLKNAKDVLDQEKLSLIGLIKRMTFLIIFYYNKDKLSKAFPFYKIMLNGYSLGIIIYFIFNKSFLVLISRGSIYFNIMEPILIVCQFMIYRKKREQIFLIIVLFLISIYMFINYIQTYPDLFIPYKAII